jgi:hypothetical protein
LKNYAILDGVGCDAGTNLPSDDAPNNPMPGTFDPYSKNKRLRDLGKPTSDGKPFFGLLLL